MPTQTDKVAENHTVTCHENDVDIFKSAGLDSNLDTSKQSHKLVTSPSIGSTQKIICANDLKENTSSNVLCPRVSKVEAKRQVQRTVLPSPQMTPGTPQINMLSTIQSPSTLNLPNAYVSRPALSRSSNMTKGNPPPRTSQNVPNLRMSSTASHHIPGTSHVDLSSNTHPQVSLRATTSNVSRTALSRTPNTAESNLSSTTFARCLSTPHSTVSNNGASHRASNVRNISPMDLLIDLTKPKPNSVKTTLGNQTQSLKFVVTSQQSNVSRASNPRPTISSRVKTVRTVRSTLIPLAPKPAPYTPVTFAEQFPIPGSNYKRLAAKLIAGSEPKSTHQPQQAAKNTTTTTPPLVFHSTEFVSQGSTVVQKQTTTTQGIPFSSSTQVKNRPTHVAQNRPQGTPTTSLTRPTVPVTTKVVQLSKIPTQPKLKDVQSKVVKLITSPGQAVLKPNQATPKIVQLNTDPAHLAANFLRLRAKATQGGSKTISLVPTQSNSPHHKTSSPVLSVKHVPTPTLTQHSSKPGTSTPISTTPKVSHSNFCSATPTKVLPQNVTSVAAVKGSNDSDGMAVVVGSPEQITKLLSENPNMIELLGSKSTDYLGKLLTSHSKKESYVARLSETTTTGGQQNKCASIKEALKRPTPRVIDLTKSPSKHVIDLTKDENKYPKSSGARNLQLTPTASILPSTLTTNRLSSTVTPSSLSSTITQSRLSSVVSARSSLSSTPSSLTSSLTASSLPSTSTSVKTNKIDLTKCRNAVRKLDRSCLDTNFRPKGPGMDAVSLGKPVQPGAKSPTLDVHPSVHSPTNANPQYIFQNRRFLHASLDTPSLGKKANRVSPLSSPTRIMAHVEDQSRNLKPVVSESQQGVKYYRKLQASEQQEKKDKTLNNGETGSISKKDIVKSRGKRTYTKRTYTKRKGLDKDGNGKSKKNDGPVSAKRKNDENCLRSVKRTKIAEDDIVLPDFARVKQSDLRSKRLEKVNQELNVMFIITSEEGLEVKAKTCEGTRDLLCSTSGSLNRLA